ncbi:MAG TPA: TlpA disulfide reductase family protein [Herpetosiphonaceae bacterium]
MLRLTPSQWNRLLLGVMIFGTLFIAATRVRPNQSLPLQLYTTAVLPAPAPAANHPAPDFALPLIDGSTVKLSDLNGKVVLINVWATWCPPCRAEMPAIQAAYETYRDQGFIVLAVNLREHPRTVAAFMEQFGLTFQTPLDLEGHVSDMYRASVLPSSFFVDRQGVIRAVYRGPMPRSVIAGTAEQLLGYPPSEGQQ